MNGGLNEILSTILENTDAASKLSELLTGAQGITSITESKHTTPLAQSEKQIRLRQKIDILTALMPLLGDEYSKKADTVIKALSAAIVILGFSEQKS